MQLAHATHGRNPHARTHARTHARAHTPHVQVLSYYCLELAWYSHLLLKPVLRYGLADGRDMLTHHAASLALILVSYGVNLTRMGVMVLALFGVRCGRGGVGGAGRQWRRAPGAACQALPPCFPPTTTHPPTPRSNPFLHIAKMCNQLGSSARMPAFALFAALFFVTRVVMVPPAVLKTAMLDPL